VPERLDLIVLTHGHNDHVGDTLALWETHRPPIIAQGELRKWLEHQGVEEDITLAPNKGGTVEAAGVRVSLTDAKHSSSAPDLTYTGEPTGVVLRLEEEMTLYFAGDTCVFGDMELIGRLYQPDLAVLPIGGHFTMDPPQAAIALELLGVRRCLPCHYGTFPFLTGTPAELEQLAPDVQVLAPGPGETIDL
jgi:L-ascorbate metabolism protein UlaG (beta-lactamase superfamily)